MYKISIDAAHAYNNNYYFKRNNTEVVVVGSITKMYLHGNCIAKKDRSTQKFEISTCGWDTKTTKDRLIALGYDVCIRNGEMRYRESGKLVNYKRID